jgi:hypothetical protein
MILIIIITKLRGSEINNFCLDTGNYVDSTIHSIRIQAKIIIFGDIIHHVRIF